jgi:hypothetical protein
MDSIFMSFLSILLIFVINSYEIPLNLFSIFHLH